MKQRLSILLPVAFVVVVIACTQNALSLFIDPARHAPVFPLDGEWEYYPDRFITPGQFDTYAEQRKMVKLPASWRQFGQQSLGIATFRKTLRLPSQVKNPSIHFPSIHSANRIFINGVLVDSSGNIGMHGAYQAKIRTATISIPENMDTLEIVVMVANYTTLEGGILKKPFIQNTTALVRATNLYNGFQNCIIGILLCMFSYQVILFFFYREGTSYLVLGIICLLVAIRSALVTGASQLLSESVPGIDTGSWFKLGFITVFLTLFLLPLYVRLLFPVTAPKWPLYIYLVVTIVLVMLALFTPHYVYYKYLDIYHVGMLTAFVYAVYSIFRAFKNGNDEARLILWGVVVSFPFVLMEMLQNSLVVRLGTGIPFLTEIGLLVFLQFQVILLANRYALSYRALKVVNQNLELIIYERTMELQNANKIKERLLSILSHDIRSPLTSLRSIIGLFNKKAIDKEQFSEMLDLLETELGKTNLLVDNILSWSSDQLKGVSIRKEKFDVLRLLELNIQLFHSALEKKHILVCHNLIDGLEVETDHAILNTVVRNLLANAIKFTPPSGKITIEVSAERSKLQLAIRDTGIGMDENTIQSLLRSREVFTSKGTNNETGTGLGILLCRELLHRLNGDLNIESQVNIGSKFMVTIPLDTDRERNFPS